MITIEEQILQNAKLFPNKIALIAGETVVTYGELWERCLRTAYVLRTRLALKKGDRVIIAAAGNIEFVYTYFGVHIAGGICVPIDPDTNQTRFDYIYESTKPVAVLGVLHKVDRKPVSFEEITTGGETRVSLHLHCCRYDKLQAVLDGDESVVVLLNDRKADTLTDIKARIHRYQMGDLLEITNPPLSFPKSLSFQNFFSSL